jgi:hypothetical protein
MRSVVQLYPGPPLHRGAVAQLGERLVCNQEATGSIPVSSTNSMLGVNTTTESVSRFKVAWRRTLGWMTEGLHTPKVATIHTRLGGLPVKTGEDDI